MSWSFLPKISSAANFKKSSWSPNTLKTLKYAPNATPGFPDYIKKNLEREIIARSATCKVVNFLLLRANFIFSPDFSRSKLYFENIICFLEFAHELYFFLEKEKVLSFTKKGRFKIIFS